MTPRDPARDERLADWVDGRLGNTELGRLEAEFRADPEFEREAERYRRAVESLRGALSEEDPPVGLADRIVAHIDAERAPRPLLWMPIAGSLAAAAALVLVFVWIRGGTAPEEASTSDVALRPEAAVSTLYSEDRRPVATEGVVREGDGAVRQQSKSGRAAPAPGLVLEPGEAEREELQRDFDLPDTGTSEDGPAIAILEEARSKLEMAEEQSEDDFDETPKFARTRAPEGERRAGADRGDEAVTAATAVANPDAPDDETSWHAGVAGAFRQEVVVLIELPPAAAADLDRITDTVRKLRDDEPAVAPPAEHVDGAEVAGAEVVAERLPQRVPLADAPVSDAWSQQVVDLLQRTVADVDGTTANVTAPTVYAVTTVAPSGGWQFGLGAAVDSRSTDDQARRPKDVPTDSTVLLPEGRSEPSSGRGFFALMPPDAVFQVVGDATQLASLIRELGVQARAAGGALSVQRTAPVEEAETGAGNTALDDLARLRVAQPPTGAWIVVRRQSPEPSRAAEQREVTGPATPADEPR